MMRYLIFLIFILLLGCGSRKVDLHKRINDIETNLQIKIKELEFERNQMRVYEVSRSFKADSIVEKDGKRTIYNPSSEEKEKGKEELAEKSKEKETDVKEQTHDKSKEKIKITERESFNYWNLLFIIPLLIIILLSFKTTRKWILKLLFQPIGMN